MNKCKVCDKEEAKNKYCSQECYHSRPLSYSVNEYEINGDVAVFKTTNGVFKVDSVDVDLIKDRLWHFTKSNGVISNKRRAERGVGKSGHIKLHRLLMQPTKDMDIDHINGDKRDNRRSNLRVVEHWQNMVNTKSREMRNIERRTNSQTYCVRMKKSGKRYYIGNFATLRDAKAARDEAAKKIHGELRVR